MFWKTRSKRIPKGVDVINTVLGQQFVSERPTPRSLYWWTARYRCCYFHTNYFTAESTTNFKCLNNRISKTDKQQQTSWTQIYARITSSKRNREKYLTSTSCVNKRVLRMLWRITSSMMDGTFLKVIYIMSSIPFDKFHSKYLNSIVSKVMMLELLLLHIYFFLIYN